MSLPNLSEIGEKILPCWNPLTLGMGFPRVRISPCPRVLFNGWVTG
ncbi:hypothetical protein [Microseira wollei]|nr:hypothetical protein [Microseira wollei]